ncbi:hypothetical protein PHMEG_00033069 [Phytophthora megakarya]|uniref:Uncharacterized protein n=1 Tax=Phytophthora megakarya TaxID=4795 RepID=A0A225UU47_9STRA|nr:hypothetical protein PHMEG_00033069 [Phytophthora megakarya]
MTWHGVMVRFWNGEDTMTGRQAVENTVYFDQISAKDNKQDKFAVVSYLEAMFLTLKRDLPQIKSDPFNQSDNASAYQNPFVGLILRMFDGIKVDRYIHAETQDRKSMLDVHFARAKKKTGLYVQQGNNCVMPSQLVKALVADGCLPNCMAELIKYSREKMEQLSKEFISSMSASSRQIGRTNDIFYNTPDLTTVSDEFQLSTCPHFEIRMFDYSGIGSGRTFVVKPQPPSRSMSSNMQSIQVSNRNQPPNTVTILHVENESLDETNRDESGDTCYNYGGGINHEDEGDSDSESENSDSDFVEEVIIPEIMTGFITGVEISTSKQIRRRARKWKTLVSVNILTTSSSNRHRPHRPRDLLSYVTGRLAMLKNTDSLQVFSSSDILRELVGRCDLVLDVSILPNAMKFSEG